MWRYEVRHGGKRLMGLLHVTLFVCGLIIFIGGTTAVCIQIRDAYRNGLIGGLIYDFDCDSTI